MATPSTSLILDLLITTNEGLIRNLQVGEPFSDHNSIAFEVTMSSSRNLSHKKVYKFTEAKRIVYKRAKASNSDNLWTRYRNLNNRTKKACNQPLWEYLEHLSKLQAKEIAIVLELCSLASEWNKQPCDT